MRKFDPSAVFDRSKCVSCGVCARVCPVAAIRSDELGAPVSFAGNCIGCGHCGCYCPENCFGLEPLREGSGTALDRLFRSRRSVRHFTAEPLTREVLAEILSPLDCSPTGRNQQGIRVKVLLGAEKVRGRIALPVIRIVRLLDCFGLVSLLAGPSKPLIRRLRQGEDLIAQGAPCVLIFTAPVLNATGREDCLIAASSVALKATEAGLGTLWNGVVRMLAPLLGLGRASAVLCLGYPALKPRQAAPERIWSTRDI